MQSWLKEFGLDDPDAPLPTDPKAGTDRQTQRGNQTGDPGSCDGPEITEDFFNPFPPGFADDLLNEE
jgi:hypothetical protein